MTITLTLIALVCAALFSGIAIYEKIPPNGKISLSTKISLIFFCLMLITGIADDIAKDQCARQDKQELFDKIDSSANTINRKLDSLTKPRPVDTPASPSH